MIHIPWLLSHPRREGIHDLHLHVLQRFFPISPGAITWNMYVGEPTIWIKFINLNKKSTQSLRQKICHKALFTSIQSYLDQIQEWLGYICTKWGDSMWNHKLFIKPSVDGPHPLTFNPFLTMKIWSLFSWNICWVKHPLTTKCLRVEWKVTHIMRALYWQFCWDSKLRTHRHYRLLPTRSW